MPPTTVREALLRTLKLVEIGWTRGRNKKMRGPRACYCISGAVQASMPDDYYALRTDTFWYIRRAIGPFAPNLVNVPEWNDAPGRTKPQVIAVLKQAINLASAR